MTYKRGTAEDAQRAMSLIRHAAWVWASDRYFRGPTCKLRLVVKSVLGEGVERQRQRARSGTLYFEF
jgi:hypothetical protein